ncbi:hypothetical protein BZA77DRAFT_372957 [Pyronema omphalodes]|nr:hypothetical protein BZA77DRAFT_372957 [Pyronema omphalodes]
MPRITKTGPRYTIRTRINAERITRKDKGPPQRTARFLRDIVAVIPQENGSMRIFLERLVSYDSLKVICVANLEHNQILQKANLLRNSSGLKLKRFNKPVKSENPSVRGIYSPFHGANWQI